MIEREALSQMKNTLVKNKANDRIIHRSYGLSRYSDQPKERNQPQIVSKNNTL